MKNVKIYSTPTCTYCLMAKDFMDSKGIEYNEIDVSANQDKVQELLKLTDGQMGVPVIVVDGEVIFGFDKNKLEELLEI